MKITVELENIDYGALVEKALPLVADKLLEKDGVGMAILSKIAKVPPSLVTKMLNILPQDNKDDIAVTLIEKNKDKIISALLEYAGENGLSFDIKELGVEK